MTWSSGWGGNAEKTYFPNKEEENMYYIHVLYSSMEFLATTRKTRHQEGNTKYEERKIMKMREVAWIYLTFLEYKMNATEKLIGKIFFKFFNDSQVKHPSQLYWEGTTVQKKKTRSKCYLILTYWLASSNEQIENPARMFGDRALFSPKYLGTKLPPKLYPNSITFDFGYLDTKSVRAACRSSVFPVTKTEKDQLYTVGLS